MYSSLVSLLGWAWSWEELILQRTVGTTDMLAFSLEWQILGPFQIGTREATWGADPLEYFGGFRALEYNESARYRSSLATNRTVTWSTQLADVSGGCPFNAQANLTVRFPDVQWLFLQSIYGWAALQWQAWARGSIGVTGANVKTIALYTDNVLEFYVDGVHYFGGDVYAIRRAPLVLHLEPGDHRIDVRVIRDVRAMGAVGEPKAEIRLEAAESQKDPSAQKNPGGLIVEERSLLVPDMVNRSLLASSLGSITVRNEGRRWIKIQQIISTEVLNPDDGHLFPHKIG
ncbi:MAG: hypothetical protein Q9167_007265 [Letrouitia subvulpina]